MSRVDTATVMSRINNALYNALDTCSKHCYLEMVGKRYETIYNVLLLK